MEMSEGGYPSAAQLAELSPGDSLEENLEDLLDEVEGVRGSVSAEDGGGRWAEDGWYLLPLIALLLLPLFRREEQLSPTEEIT